MFDWLKKIFTQSSVRVPEKRVTKGVPLNSLKGYTCDECHGYITRKELSRTWDWGGPHCPHCGNTGISMFANIIEQESPKGIRMSKRGN